MTDTDHSAEDVVGGSATPWLSVVLPCWNAEESIERAMRSVLETRSIELECVVIDDASTDATVEVAASLAADDDRVVLLRQPAHQGVSAARNRGLREVRGQWLTFLDADDRYLPGGLELLARAASASDADAVIGQQVWSDGARTWIGPLYDIPDIRVPGRKSLAANPGLLYYVSPHAKVFRRAPVAELEFSGRVQGDQEWVIRALLRAGDRIEVLEDTVYEWYRPAKSRSITGVARSSTSGGIEATHVAVKAFRAVSREADAHLDAHRRDIVLTRYVERLFRSDLGAHIGNAIGRSDPTSAELLDAVRSFVADVPAPYLARSDSLVRDILEPTLYRLRRLDLPGRAAYWRLFETGRRRDPALHRKGTNRLSRLALRVATWHPARIAHRAARFLMRRALGSE